VSIRSDVLRFVDHLALIAALLVLLSPALLFQAVLWDLGPLPAKPAQLASAERQTQTWKLAKGEGAPHVDPMNPYGFLWRFVAGDPTPMPGETLAYRVARDHVMAQPHRSMLRWHLSNAVLAIWLTRHWTAEELATAGGPTIDQELQYRARRAARVQAEERSRAASAM